ncbi:ABC transporter ATP-binding protein [Nocardioides sp. LMS-CY]|uniref:ABC transporter ATP-binding protein n=1 Tax=Nocardioides sp. (strain LMS-CY) TaxID=2840457 RepID=UPI001C000AE7|nr:ABC transporter ATP-binding protein [Nocardioides sp. LMS-CY]QWF21935.1 ABC transporter ATP-binding protein [Nocardioides sp. LMS-CY]
MTGLVAHDLTLGYGERVVSTGLSLAVPPGRLTAVIGPNACGKSTLLRALVRLQEPRAGRVELDGVDLRRLRPREVARRIGFLPQRMVAPEGISVTHLVRRGRYPHRDWRSTWTDVDEAAVTRALLDTGVEDLASRRIEELSGGQAQRVWLAMVLAQETELLLLDEPTTFLDLAHQYDLLRLLARLRDAGRTVVVVLHDVNQAARFADHLVAMQAGRVVAAGAPAEVVTADLVEQVFGLACEVVPDPVAGSPMVVAH